MVLAACLAAFPQSQRTNWPVALPGQRPARTSLRLAAKARVGRKPAFRLLLQQVTGAAHPTGLKSPRLEENKQQGDEP